MDKKQLLRCLRDSLKNSSIKFPAGIDFQGNNRAISIIMRNGVTKNMQEDSAAFEGWALVVRTHIPDVRSVHLTWDVPSDINNPHYQRFLYRVDRFAKIFSEWFVCECPHKEHLKIRSGQPEGFYQLNVPTKKRTDIPPLVKQWSERWLERILVEDRDDNSVRAELLKKTNIEVLGNQLPVGVFEREVAEETAVFTGKASAIDLWGVNSAGDELSLLELKKPGNAKVGALSELFFYAMVMKDVIDGRFAFSDKRYPGVDPWPPDYITRKILRIKAYLLVNKPHCLVSGQVLNAMNCALAVYGISVGQLWIDSLEKERDR